MNIRFLRKPFIYFSRYASKPATSEAGQYWISLAEPEPWDAYLLSPTTLREEFYMAIVFVEARPKGRSDGEPITGYVVEDHAAHVLAMFDAQLDAIKWSKEQGHRPHVSRVRHLNDKKRPDHGREA